MNAPSTSAPWAHVPVVPVIVLDEVTDAVPLARALLEGGVDVIEVTLRTAAALDAIRVLRAEAPQLVIGAGTVLTPRDTDAAVSAGAQFLVSPGSVPGMRQAFLDSGLPALPGAATISEAMALSDAGFDCLKLFPAAQIGGLGFVQALASVLPRLLVCPTGGLDPSAAQALLAEPTVACVGGSWIAPRADIRDGRWDQIARRARESHGLRQTPTALTDAQPAR